MAVKAFDIKLDKNGDFNDSTGDFQIVESSEEHLYALMQSATNDYKLDSIFGINLQSNINSALNQTTLSLKRIIEKNMIYDNFSVSDLIVKGNLSTETLKIQTSGQRIK